MLSILTADIFGGTSGFLLSTSFIVVFGEIIPQASCSRYGLYIGAASIPIVRVLILLFFPLAYPMAWCLDKVLGEEMGTIHSKSEMKKVRQRRERERKREREGERVNLPMPRFPL